MADSPDEVVSQIPAKLDGRFAVTWTEFGVDEDTPMQVPGGGFGNIGVAAGNTKYTGSATMVILKTVGPEFDIDTLTSKPHTLTFPLGPRKYQYTGLRFNKKGLKVDQDKGAPATVSGSFVAVHKQRVR